MIFTNDKAIYIQMADRLCDEILAEKYKDDDRIPSVREYAVMLEVNANTVVKAYDELSRANIIYNKRGLGYFVTPGAKKQILKERKQEFMKERLPELFRQMQLLGITIKHYALSIIKMIHLQDINKTYQGAQPLHVLKGISLDIAKGEFVSIMGASGSGKSTLLNILGILDNYDSGTYELAGVPIWNLSERRAAEYRNKMIGFIFQSFNLISFKTAVENVELPLFYQGVSRRKRHTLALEYLERLGLLDWAEHYPNELSGGQKQRVAIARALITRVEAAEPRRGHDTDYCDS